VKLTLPRWIGGLLNIFIQKRPDFDGAIFSASPSPVQECGRVHQ
jgi:hypothetical protein